MPLMDFDVYVPIRVIAENKNGEIDLSGEDTREIERKIAEAVCGTVLKVSGHDITCSEYVPVEARAYRKLK